MPYNKLKEKYLNDKGFSLKDLLHKSYGVSLLTKSMLFSLFIMIVAVTSISVIVTIYMTKEKENSIKPTLRKAIAIARSNIYSSYGYNFHIDNNGGFYADDKLINGDFKAVDEVTNVFYDLNVSATIFAKSITSDGKTVFCRISTNVMIEEQVFSTNCQNVFVGKNIKTGNMFRALGTELEYDNDAYKAIMNGEIYNDKIDILNIPYFTIYEPIFAIDENNNKDIIGIIYVGIKEADFFATIKYIRKIIFLSASIIITILTLIVILLYRQMFNPLRLLIKTMIKMDRGDIDVEIPCLTLKDEFGDMARTLSVFGKNIKEKQELAAEKEKANEILQRAIKMEAVGTLAGGIAHDFNNILTAILGHICMIMDYFSPNDETLSSLKQIKKATERAMTLVSKLLDFSRQQEAAKKIVNIERIIDEIINLARASVPSSIKIKWTRPEKTYAINADTSQIHQVLLNLLHNSADAIGLDTGIIEILVENINAINPIVGINRTLPAGKYVKIAVKDTGCGMDKHILERAFVPFFTTKEYGKGTGLGLAAVHGIVENHNGTIEVESYVGKGTLIAIHLPAVDETEKQKENDNPIDIKGSENIIFISNEPLVINSIGTYLERLGYYIESMTKPETALSLVKEKPKKYQLIITEQLMPEITGFELAQKINEFAPNLPIIICGNAFFEKNKNINNVVEYIEKPIKPHKLAKTIRKILEDKSLKEKL